jgi:hypothetical protein
MLQAKRVNGFEIPEWAQCYCVVQHRPGYIHPIPFELPDGRVLYLCANSHHQVTTLYNMYLEVGGAPQPEIRGKFNVFSQRLARVAFQMHLAMEAKDDEN